MKLPNSVESVEVLQAKLDAVDTVDQMIKRNLELEDIFDALQPLLYELSVKLYKDDNSTVTLQKLIEDGVKFLKGETE